jgi:4-amino-4-deoxy-L-arabinose transferase-like glycosyltransferase
VNVVARHRAGRRSDRAPRVGLLVTLATVLLYGVLALWTCVTPDYRAPDEPQQVSTTLRLAYWHSYPAPGGARIFPAVKGSYHDVGFGGIGLNTIIGLGPLHRPSSDQLTGQTMAEIGAGANGAVTPYDYDQMTQHPPGYFAVMAVPARVFDVIDKTPHTALLILRLCSALLLLPLPYFAFRIARALGVGESAAAAASFLPLALPQLTHIGAAVNNDTLTVTLSAAVTWLALEVARRPRARWWAVSLGVVTTALLLTKGTALPMLVVVLAAYLLRLKRFGSRRTVRSAVVTLVLLLPGLAWWVANVVRFDKLQPDGYPKSYLDLLPKGGHLAFGTWLHGFFPALTRSFFADFGWLEAPPPSAVTACATAVVLLLIAVGVARAWGHVADALLAQLSWVMPLVAIMYTSYNASQRIGALQGVQGRYIFAGVAAMAATTASALRPGAGGRGVLGVGGRPRGGRGLPPYALAPVAAVVLAGFGVAAGISHFYSGSGFSGEFGTFTAWSPLRLRVLVPIAICCGAGALWAAALLLRRDTPDYSRPPEARRADIGVSAHP